MSVHSQPRIYLARAISILVFSLVAISVRAQFQAAGIPPEFLKNVGLTQRLDNPVPPNLQFRDEQGRPVLLGQFFGRKPLILTLVYFQCPMLCTQVLNSLLQSVKDNSLQLGRDYDILTVSIDPHDRPIEAQAKQILYSGLYGRDPSGHGWHFFTGEDDQIHALADAVGFRYVYDPRSDQYAHPAAIMVLTPSGKVSRYFYGLTYHASDLRLGLVEASHGAIGSPVDAVLLYCCSYDPLTGKYSLIVSRVVSIAGGLTVLALAALLIYLRRGETYALPGSHA